MMRRPMLAVAVLIIASCAIPPTAQAPVAKPAPQVITTTTVPAGSVVVKDNGSTVAVIAAPVAATAVELPAKIVDHSCTFFHPIYLTPAEVKSLSAQTLTAIVNNNNEGATRCGWKHTPGE